MSFCGRGVWEIESLGRGGQSQFVTGENGDPTFELTVLKMKSGDTLKVRVDLTFATQTPYPVLVMLKVEETNAVYRNFCAYGTGVKPMPFDTGLTKDDLPPGPLKIKYLLRHENIIFSGLQNPRPVSATCYMNCVLQMLFQVCAFRKLIFEMPLVEENLRFEKVMRALRDLYGQMSKPGTYSTDDFTKALGWTKEARRIQHDVMDFLSSLLTYLESRGGDGFKERIQDLFYIRMLHQGKETEYLNLEVDMSSGEDVVFADALRHYVDVVVGGKITKLPKVLFIHLNRACEATPCKCEAKCEYPDEFDMSEIAEGAGRYRLHAIVLHQGKQSTMGHYFLLSRPSVLKQWIKFHDANVDVVVPRDPTIKESYGECGKPVAVVLAYVDIACEEDVYQYLAPLGCSSPMSDVTEESGETQAKTKQVFIATDEDIALACESGLPSVEKIVPRVMIEVPSESTQNQLYNAVAKAMNLDLHSFSLRFASLKKQPAKLLVRRSDTKNILQKTGSSCFFYLERELTVAPMDAATAPIFFALFNPGESTSTTRYLLRMNVNVSKPLETVLGELKMAMDKPDLEDQDIGIFYDGSLLDVKKTLRECVRSAERVGGCFLVVQDLSDNGDMDASARPGFVSYYQTLATVLEKPIRAHEFRYYHAMMHNSVEATFWRFGDSEPSFQMMLPYNDPELTADVLKKMIQHVTKCPTVTAVYHAFRPGCPEMNPMRGRFNQSFNENVRRDYCIYFDTSEHGEGVSVRVSTSEDSLTSKAIYELSLPTNATLADAAKAIGWNPGNSRALRIVDSVIHQVLPLDTHVANRQYYRLEWIPEEDEDNQRLVCVNYGIIFNETLHIAKFGQPFLLPIFEEDTSDDIMSRARSMVMEVSDDEISEFLVTKHGDKIVSENLEILKSDPSLGLTITVNILNPLAFFDPDSFFQGGIRFLN